MPLAKCSCWEVERVGAKGAASQMVLVTSSDCLELHHPCNALPARPCWQCASQSGGDQNTDDVEIDHYVFSYLRVMFCVLGVC